MIVNREKLNIPCSSTVICIWRSSISSFLWSWYCISRNWYYIVMWMIRLSNILNHHCFQELAGNVCCFMQNFSNAMYVIYTKPMFEHYKMITVTAWSYITVWIVLHVGLAYEDMLILYWFQLGKCNDVHWLLDFQQCWSHIQFCLWWLLRKCKVVPLRFYWWIRPNSHIEYIGGKSVGEKYRHWSTSY